MSNNIENTNRLAFEYAQAMAPQILNLCEPLLSGLGLTTFLYGRIFFNGKYILLSNNVKWVEKWYYSLSTLENTFLQQVLQNATLGEPFYFLWSSIEPDNLLKFYNSLGIWHGFDINYRLEDSVEGWSFSTSEERSQINTFYLNNIKLFHRFCLYFRENAASLLDTSDKNRLAIFKDNFDLSFQPSFFKTDDVKSFSSFLLRQGFSIQTHNGRVKFSKRELECIFHLSQGKSVKEIGQLLDISPRTVESYIITSKHKAGYENKSALIDSLRNDLIKIL